MKDVEIAVTGADDPPRRGRARAGLHRASRLGGGRPERFLAELGARIRGVATGSHAKVDGAFMDCLPRLEVIANFGVGYDSVDAARPGGAASW